MTHKYPMSPNNTFLICLNMSTLTYLLWFLSCAALVFLTKWAWLVRAQEARSALTASLCGFGTVLGKPCRQTRIPTIFFYLPWATKLGELLSYMQSVTLLAWRAFLTAAKGMDVVCISPFRTDSAVSLPSFRAKVFHISSFQSNNTFVSTPKVFILNTQYTLQMLLLDLTTQNTCAKLCITFTWFMYGFKMLKFKHLPGSHILQHRPSFS